MITLPMTSFLLVAASLLGVGAAPGPADSVPTLTVVEARAAALRHHPLMAASAEATDAVRARQSEVEASRWPDASISLSAVRWDWVMPNKKVYLGDSPNDVLAEIEVQHVFFDGGARAARIRLAADDTEGAGLSRRELTTEIVFGVERAYHAALAAERVARAQEALAGNLREHVATARLLYEAGRVSQADVVRSRVQLASAENDAATAKAGVEERRVELAAAMGVEGLGGALLEDVPGATQPDRLGAEVLEDVWLARASGHPAIESAAVLVRAREGEVSLARSAFLPRISARGAYNREGGSLLPGHPNWSVGIALSIPVFDAGARRWDRAAAEARVREASWRLEDVRRGIEAAVRTDLVRLVDARRRTASAAEVVGLADESARSVALLYRAGQTPILDVLDSEDVLLHARIAHAQALADLALAGAALRRDAGIVPDGMEP